MHVYTPSQCDLHNLYMNLLFTEKLVDEIKLINKSISKQTNKRNDMEAKYIQFKKHVEIKETDCTTSGVVVKCYLAYGAMIYFYFIYLNVKHT